MGKLPEKYPEFLIMYKTLTQQIKKLENSQTDESINKKIQSYKKELDKIKEKFPKGFFDNQ
ncbi:MAG: hypothetical protein HOK63_03455 [Thaumarchaeota archaeon]|jgi:hypothetical protein|nr:hypothetical protein [Nitrososphaerota archaeon]MBT6468693.1 hypothetical protein [Nitrososphaerota archaeon]